jgi:hypothetical protein
LEKGTESLHHKGLMFMVPKPAHASLMNFTTVDGACENSCLRQPSEFTQPAEGVDGIPLAWILTVMAVYFEIKFLSCCSPHFLVQTSLSPRALVCRSPFLHASQHNLSASSSSLLQEQRRERSARKEVEGEVL